jgi:hypothetical protein
MKKSDIVIVIQEGIEKKIIQEWKHEGYIGGCNDHSCCVVIDGIEYEIIVQETKL